MNKIEQGRYHAKEIEKRNLPSSKAYVALQIASRAKELEIKLRKDPKLTSSMIQKKLVNFLVKENAHLKKIKRHKVNHRKAFS